ncbi:MAG TPA: IPT/TIG domain-containing protein [Pyrinomonadaceae bacterium]|jgi:YD repeat-containing protein|nr:IPT/TIG domain-containing protein [Pyrinomonadaceae bacterium]
MVRTVANHALSLFCLLSLGLLLGFCVATKAQAQTTTYHLHQEASTTAGLFQVKTAAADATTVSLSSINLKNKNAGEYIIKAFDTPSGVPNSSGVVPSGSVVSFSVWMNMTSTSGSMVPRAKLMLNSANGTAFCTASGTALTQTLTKHTFSCTTSANITMTASDRLYVWVGVNVTTKATLDTFVNLSIEGTPNGNYDSTVDVPAALGPPTLTSLSPNIGPVGLSVTLTGTNFGSVQGASTITFNGTAAGTASSWSPTSISAFVPTGATTGSVVLTVGGQVSNSLSFTLTPQITTLSPNAGVTNDVVTITGTNFGATQGTSTLKFNGITASPTSWNTTTIVAPVPAGVTTGPVVVTVGGQASNGAVFTVPAPATVTDTLTVYLHKEASTSSGRFQLKLTPGDAAVFPIQTGDLKGLPTNADYLIKEFDTQANVPNVAGVIPINSPIKFTLWMKKTTNFGEFYPKVKLTLLNGTPVCECHGATSLNNQITTTLFDWIVTCNTTSELTLTATDRFYLWVGVYAYPPAADTVRAELDIEQTRESNFVIPLPVPRPVISSITPSGASTGSSVTINGSNFGSQETNTVTFSGVLAVPTSWSSTQIVTPVPFGATTGPVVVTVRKVASAGFTYSPAAGTISGTVTRVLDSSPVAGAFVEAVQGGNYLGAVRTSATGTYSIGGLATGTYEVRASADLYANESQTGVSVTEGSTTTANIALYKSGSIGGRITQQNGTTAIPGAAVKAYQNDQVVGSVVTDSNGDYVIPAIRPGTSTVRVSAIGYDVKTQTGVSVSEQANTTLNLSLDTASSANLIKYNYDEVGRLTTVENGVGQVAKYSYDAAGNLLTISRHDSTQVSVLQFTPSNGTTGTPVTIYGTGFSATPAQNTVTFNGVSATVISSSSSEITTTVPAGVTTGPIGVTSPTGSASSATSFTVPTNGPTITSFTPNIADPGATVAITGTNFDTALTKNVVAMATGRGLVTGATASSLNVTVPARGGSGKIRVTTPTGVAQSAQDFFFPPSPTYFGCCTASQVEYVGRMSFGQSHVVNITVANKKALVIFDAVAGQRMGLTINNALTTTPQSLSYTIFNPDGSIFMPGSINGPGTAFVNSTKTTNLFGGYTNSLSFTGTYMILLDPINGCIGTVTLTLADVLPDVSFGIDPGGPTKTVSTMSSSQNALVTFKGYTGQHVSLRLANATVDGRLRVFSPDWVVLGDKSIDNDNNNPNTRFMDTITLSKPGTYTILVSLTGSESTTRSIDLTLYDVPADISNPSTLGSPVTANLVVPGQDALFTFSGTAGDRVSFDIPATTADGDWRMFGPDGNEVSFSPTIFPSFGGFIEPVTLPTTGNYNLTFDGDYIAGSVTATRYSVPADFSGSVVINGSAANLSLSPGQKADLTFTGTANQLVTVRVTGNNLGEVTVKLFDASNNELTSTTSNATTFNLTQKTLSANGTYRINVNPTGVNAGNISVSVTSP